MMKIFMADLTHTAQGVSAPTFPLGISYVMSYAQKLYGKIFDFRLFKYPRDLTEALNISQPEMLCFSSYSWNFQISYAYAEVVKTKYPNTVIVFGGPNFPTSNLEKLLFMKRYPAIDFFVESEGEIGFSLIIKHLIEFDLNQLLLRKSGILITNVYYINNQFGFSGPLERIMDVNDIPSPYLSGVLDPFFDQRLIPMLETTRGCPFACTFCADGLPIKNRVTRFHAVRVVDELKYIANRINGIEELIITDLNFAMYAQDLPTARAIKSTKEQFGWPVLISASAGKNKPERTIEVAKILDEGWTMGASIQSTDPSVLKAIKRANISSAAYKSLIQFGNTQKNSKTHSEIILGLPGDTREKHYESLRFGVDNEVNSMRMFQAMLLPGTEMASPESRSAYELVTKWRCIPGCAGIYDVFEERLPIAEVEEIIVGNASMSFDDYLDCRKMNLIIETFYNNALFEELFQLLRFAKLSVFDCLLEIKNAEPSYEEKVANIFSDFMRQTTCDLYESSDAAKRDLGSGEVINKYIGGELGVNELLLSKSMLVIEFDCLSDMAFSAAGRLFQAASKYNNRVEFILQELKAFMLLRKRNVLDYLDLDVTACCQVDFSRPLIEIFDETITQSKGGNGPFYIRFYRSDEQRRHMRSQIELYEKTPIGMGRLMQRSNMKRFYRSFEKMPNPETYDVVTTS